MPKHTTEQNEKPVTTAQKLGSVIESARDIRRTDKGLNGESDHLLQLTWIIYLKVLDDSEKLYEVEAELEGISSYKPTIQPPYRWRDWAANENFTGDRLKSFINNDEAILPDGTKGAGLLAYLRSLKSKTGRDRAAAITKVFKDVNNRMNSGTLLWEVLNKVNEIHFDKSEAVNILSTTYEYLTKNCSVRGSKQIDSKLSAKESIKLGLMNLVLHGIGEDLTNLINLTMGSLESYVYQEPEKERIELRSDIRKLCNNGICITERPNRIEKAYAFERSKLENIKDKKEFNHAGIYILLGDPKENNQEIYIGETEHFLLRLNDHKNDNNKNFWINTFLLTSKDNSLNKAKIGYLEDRFIKLIEASSRNFIIFNKKKDQKRNLDEYDLQVTEDFFEYGLELLRELGFSI